jgi:hypothetical protein
LAKRAQALDFDIGAKCAVCELMRIPKLFSPSRATAIQLGEVRVFVQIDSRSSRRLEAR